MKGGKTPDPNTIHPVAGYDREKEGKRQRKTSRTGGFQPRGIWEVLICKAI